MGGSVGDALGGLAGGLISVGTGLAVGGFQQSRQAEKEARRARRIEQRRQRLAATRSAIEQVRQGQIARAEVIAQGEMAGASGSSAVQGGAGAVQSQVGGNIAFQNQMYQLQAQAAARMEKANKYQSRANELNQLTSQVASFALGG